MVRIFDYNNYRKYLADYINDKKKTKNLSFRFFAKKFGFNSPNYVQAILSEKRSISVEKSQQISESLGLNDIEGQYFKILVQLSGNLSSEKKTNLKKELLRLAKQANKESINSEKAYDHLLVIMLWEFFQVTESSWSVERVIKSLKIPVKAKDVESAFQSLEKLNVIEKNQTGSYRKTKEAYFEPIQDRSVKGIKRCHKTMIDNSRASINLGLDDRELQGLVLAVPKDQWDNIKQDIRLFMTQLNNKYSEQEGSNLLLQIQIGAVKLGEID